MKAAFGRLKAWSNRYPSVCSQREKHLPASLAMNNLSLILCGTTTTAGLGKLVLDQLNTSISQFSDKANTYMRASDSAELLIFGPFCGRVILENGCAAIVGRLDPFRLMYLGEFQTQPQYAMGKRVKSSFSWTGDVIPDEKQSANLWDPDSDVSKISRSLLSRHFEHIYWKPAFDELLDHIAGRTDDELQDILATDPEKFISATRGKLVQMYSQLSKGVHWEFFSSALQMDEITVKTLLRDTLINMASLGLVSHFIPTSYSALQPDEAVQAYVDFRRAML
jgi:hypothetical protein